jgi:hypothetical protein
MSDPVIAEVVVRSPDGQSIVDAPGPIGADTIERYRPSPETLRDAATRLRERGFTIVQEGPVSITVSADAELFEQVFAAAPGPEGPPARIPADLADVVAAVTFPRPPELHP